MQKASKWNDKHEYVKILPKKCKNMRIRFQLKSDFFETLTKLMGAYGDWLWIGFPSRMVQRLISVDIWF